MRSRPTRVQLQALSIEKNWRGLGLVYGLA